MTTTEAVTAPPDFLAFLDRVAAALDAIFAGTRRRTPRSGPTSTT